MKNKTLTDPLIRNYPKPDKRIEVHDIVIKALAVRFSPTGTKTFVFRYRFNDKVKRLSIGRFPAITLARARQLAGDLDTQLRMGIDPMQTRNVSKQEVAIVYFGQVIDDYVKEILPEKKQSTQSDYIVRINKYIRPSFGKFAVKDLKRQNVMDVVKKIKYIQKQPVNAQRVLAVISSIFKYAISHGYIEFNPTTGIRMSSSKDNERDRFYTSTELKQLWKAFDLQNNPIKAVLKLLLLTGQRSNEIRTMEWGHLDFENKLWTIPARIAKNGREHTVPLSDITIKILLGLKVEDKKSIYVCESNKIEGRPIGHIQNATKRIRSLSAVKDFRPHDLRRTVATHMAGIGIPQQVLSKVLNHSTGGEGSPITRIYNRYDYLDEKRNALDAWSRCLIDMVR